MKGKLLGLLIAFLLFTIAFSGWFVNKKETTDNNGGISKKEIGFIQNLINNASEGDTINIPSGTYHENIVINKTINLIGENKSTTILDGSGKGNVLYIYADHVSISGFTIQNSGYGIEIYSNYNSITNNIINNNNGGIGLGSSSNNNTISGNAIVNNSFSGIDVLGSNNNVISGNTINHNKGCCGILAFYSSNNTISGNNVSNNNWSGIEFFFSNNSVISGNNINNNTDGICFSNSSNNIVYHNNLINNTQNANATGNNTWYDIISEIGNYWSDYSEKYPNAFQINNYLVGLIWDTPYNITGGNNQDVYPLFAPFNI